MLDIFLDIDCCWNDEDEREIRRINSDIERQIKRDRREAKKQYKILLLGAGESGKSTFIRHMRIIHGEGFSERERAEARETVLSNLTVSIYLVLHQMELGEPAAEKIIGEERALEREPGEGVAPGAGAGQAELAGLAAALLSQLTASEEKEVVQYVWEVGARRGQEPHQTRPELLAAVLDSPAFRDTLTSLALYRLPDSALYFLSHSHRILQSDFLPTSEDIIRMRKATTGIQETVLQFGDVNFKLVDVGGQRSERRKWIHCFEDVSSIIFIASLAEYNLKLVEDTSLNRLEESIMLFRIILKNPWLQASSMILFLNKKDIFDKKIVFFNLKDHFSEYSGRYCDSLEAQDFILEKFTGAEKRGRTAIYSHITIATDPDNVRFVFAAVKHTVLSGIVDEIFNTENALE